MNSMNFVGLLNSNVTVSFFFSGDLLGCFSGDLLGWKQRSNCEGMAVF